MTYSELELFDLNPSKEQLRGIIEALSADMTNVPERKKKINDAINSAIVEWQERLKLYRDRVHLNQDGFGAIIGMTQSQVAKLESIKETPNPTQKDFPNPTLRTLLLIKAGLEGEAIRGRRDIDNIMTGYKELKWVGGSTSLREAAKLMLDKGFSQLPVYNYVVPYDGPIKEIEERNFKGFLYDSMLLKEGLDLVKGTVGGLDIHIDEDCIVKSSIKPEELRTVLFRNKGAVAVMEAGKVIGIVTKNDLLKVGYFIEPLRLPKREEEPKRIPLQRKVRKDVPSRR